MWKNKKIIIAALCLLALAGSGTAFAATTVFDVPKIDVTLLRYEPSPAAPGNYVNFYFQIANDGGGDASNVRLKLLSIYPFSINDNSFVTISNSATPIQLDSSGIANIGPLPSSQYTVVEYRIYVAKGVIEGNYPLTLWSQPGTSDSWAVSNFSVNVQGKDKLEIQLTPSILTPGMPTDSVFVLNNTGNSILNDISLTWTENDNKVLPLGSQNTKYVNSLNPGETVEIPFTLVADPTATSGTYNLNVILNYTVGYGTIKAISSNLGVFIGGKADFDVSVQDYQTTGITFTIANIGANPTTSVSISIPNQIDYSVTGPPSSFLGNLNPGDFTLATFQIAARNFNMSNPNFNPNAVPGQNAIRNRNNTFNGTQAVGNLKVDIAYTDTNGVRNTVEKLVPIQLSSLAGQTTQGGAAGQFQRSTTGSIPIYIPVGTVAIIIVIVYLLRKRIMARIRKKKTVKT